MPDNAVTIVAAGAPLREARGVVVMLHGRGATAEDILSLNDELGQDIAYLAPQAPHQPASPAPPSRRWR